MIFDFCEIDLIYLGFGYFVSILWSIFKNLTIFNFHKKMLYYLISGVYAPGFVSSSLLPHYPL